jgi:hypothetical protein
MRRSITWAALVAAALLAPAQVVALSYAVIIGSSAI